MDHTFQCNDIDVETLELPSIAITIEKTHHLDQQETNTDSFGSDLEYEGDTISTEESDLEQENYSQNSIQVGKDKSSQFRQCSIIIRVGIILILVYYIIKSGA
jgi:hypothetical protein